MSPRRKVPGVNIQRKSISPKNYNQLKKHVIDTANDGEYFYKNEPVCAEPIRRLSDDNTYLHKKFKKMAKPEVVVSDTKETQMNGCIVENKEIHDEGAEVEARHAPANNVPLSANPGRYVCPYCQLACAKPSVLQKHIRAHTNERPYPCAPCGFAFKTKSNLYKHCRSQAHRVKMGSGERCDSEDGSEDSNPSSDGEGTDCVENPPTKIYKPKFRAALYNEDNKDAVHAELRNRIQEKQQRKQETEERSKMNMLSPTSEFLQQRISKIISDNQAIVETMEPRWSKKFLQRQSSRERESPQKSKLALALMKVDVSKSDTSFSPSYLKVNSETHTYQPLNLTKKEHDGAVGNSSIREILIKSRENEAQLRNPLRIEANEDEHQDAPYLSPGPLLGSTPLVDGPSVAKKRRVQSTTIPPYPNGLPIRRLSTSSLPCLPPSSPSSTLKSLEELSRHPMKQVNMFGGDVKVVETEVHPVRVATPETPVTDTKLVIAKTGLHASGGTLVHTTTTNSSFHMANILSADTTKLLPLAPNITTPNLSVPNGIMTIVHGEKNIPYVPGMPGPQNILPVPNPDAIVKRAKLSSLIRKPSSSVKTVPNEIPRIEITGDEEPKRFLRPTTLPLKPGSFTPKRLHQGITPTVPSLVSPETPRPKKSYGQLFLNGHAYTYLGLKCSTKSYYCTVTRPQPMYVVQSPQLNRLSMYCNWKVYSDTDPMGLGLSPGQTMGKYDSRQRNGSFSAAPISNTLLVTHSSSWISSKILDGDRSEKQSLDVVNICRPGRELYVCDECGLRCKKPSMLKKHRRIHTGIWRYTCRYCSYAFKTRSKFLKHADSRAHFKKCSELGVDPVFDVLPDNAVDMKDDLIDSEDSDDEHDSSDLEDITGTTNSLEREAACSLLSLAETSPRTSEFVTAGILPKSSWRPSVYPYKTPVSQNLVDLEIPVEREEYFRDDEAPIDLSQKERTDTLSFLSNNSEFLQHRAEEKQRFQPSVPAYLLASIAKIQEKPIISQDLSGASGPMLQAYLTAKALRDVQFKQKTIRQHADDCHIESFPETPISVVEEKRHETADDQGSNLINNNNNNNNINSVLSVETSTGKRIVVNFSSENEQRCGSPVGSLITKSADSKVKAEFFPPSSGPNHSYISVTEDGRSICVICNKTFTKPSQLRLHVNIHYFERPFRCEACSVSFRTKGHLQKHERSVSHHNKVSMNTTFGTVTTTNPRPFKCDDCKIAFRIHGHLAKHLRSKMHIMKLECIGKLPFGTYAELERSGVNLNEIDTTDCENSLESLQVLAQKLYEKDSSKFEKTSEASKLNGLDPQIHEDSSSSDGFHLPDVKSPEKEPESPRMVLTG